MWMQKQDELAAAGAICDYSVLLLPVAHDPALQTGTAKSLFQSYAGFDHGRGAGNKAVLRCVRQYFQSRRDCSSRSVASIARF